MKNKKNLEEMNAFSPGENADFGDTELIYLFFGRILLGENRHYAGKEVFGRHFWGLFTRKNFWAILFSPDLFSPGKTRSYEPVLF